MNQWYLEFWKKNKAIICLHIVVTIIISPIEILILTVYTKKLFNSLQEKNFDEFVKLFIGFIVFLSFLQVLHAWKEYIDNQITPRVQLFIRNKCMMKYISQTRDSFRTIKVMNTISTLPKYFYQNYESFLKFWIPFFSTFFFYLIFLYWVDRKVGYVSTVFFVCLLSTFYVLFRKLSSYSNKVFKNNDDLLHSYENILLNNETIQSYNKQVDELKSLEEEERKFESNRIKLVYYIDVVKFSFIIILFMYLITVFFYVYRKMMDNRSSFPTWKFVVFISILFFTVRYIITLMNQFRTIIQVNGMLYNTKNINSIETKSLEHCQLKNNNISLENVSFSYPSNPTVFILKDFNLNIKHPSSIFIKGKIGSGKSTVGKLITKMYEPNSGKIMIGDTNIKLIPMEQYRNLIYLMNQNTLLFSGKTVFENIFYAYPTLPVKSILDKFDLPPTFLRILDKKILENGINISGGQKRMIYILRVLLHPAPIVILDEPTDSLDSQSSEQIYKIIEKLHGKKTVICISHDPVLERKFSNIVSINK